MGEFHNAVSVLLEAFARGIAIIKTQRGRRKKEHHQVDSPHKTAETHLSKSLKRNRTDVKNAYGRDLARFGPSFAAGDAEAHSSLSAILFRLNTGFVSVMERFTKGRSTQADYQALVNLSNSSRIEAINTFEQLSKRLSPSSFSLAPARKSGRRRQQRKSRKGAESLGHLKSPRTKSVQSVSITPLGPATTEGWVRPKPARKLSSDSKSSANTSTKRSTPKPQARVPAQKSENIERVRSPQRTPLPRPTRENRKSMVSFASDSTKLGEIPERKWANPIMFEAGNANFPITPYYPLGPYQEPEKRRSRFMRLFRR